LILARGSELVAITETHKDEFLNLLLSRVVIQGDWLYKAKGAKMRTKSEAEQRAREIVNKWAAGALLGGWVPGASFIFAGTDMVMIRQVADTFGVGTFDSDAIGAAIGGATASGIAGIAITEAVGWIPLIGLPAKSALMSAKAKAIGEIVIDYFKDLSPLAA
jgi:hypothetical protein